VVMGLLALVLVVFPFIAVGLWATYKAWAYASSALESLDKQEKHLAYFRYIFFRFRPDVFWWSIPLNFRQLLLAFAPTLAPNDPSAQVLYVVFILVAYVAATCAFWPWKSHELNVLDICSASTLALLITTVYTTSPHAAEAAEKIHSGFIEKVADEARTAYEITVDSIEWTEQLTLVLSILVVGLTAAFMLLVGVSAIKSAKPRPWRRVRKEALRRKSLRRTRQVQTLVSFSSEESAGLRRCRYERPSRASAP